MKTATLRYADMLRSHALSTGAKRGLARIEILIGCAVALTALFMEVYDCDWRQAKRRMLRALGSFLGESDGD